VCTTDNVCLVSGVALMLDNGTKFNAFGGGSVGAAKVECASVSPPLLFNTEWASKPCDICWVTAVGGGADTFGTSTTLTVCAIYSVIGIDIPETNWPFMSSSGDGGYVSFFSVRACGP